MNTFLVVDKPPGVTSHDIVAAVRAVTGVAKVGHTGTLDPFATGVLALALTNAAAAQWVIINPLFKPGDGTRKAGRLYRTVPSAELRRCLATHSALSSYAPTPPGGVVELTPRPPGLPAPGDWGGEVAEGVSERAGAGSLEGCSRPTP